jgi:8-oxo-dGTP pyrophosphatase MutT (NUDIX family)
LAEARPHGFTVTRLDRLEARLVGHDWAWARDNAAMVAANWQRRRAERPGLFDGPVLLACGCELVGSACTVRFFETTYAPFIAYRDAGSPDAHVANAFAAIVPCTGDGAVLLGEMGGHTANAGQIYFPCGTPDRDDLRGEAVDLAGSAAREFREETGLSVSEGRAEGWVMLRGGERQLAFLQPVRFPEAAEPLRARIERHRSREDEPELARIVVAKRRADIDPARMPGFVQAYLASVLGP